LIKGTYIITKALWLKLLYGVLFFYWITTVDTPELHSKGIMHILKIFCAVKIFCTVNLISLTAEQLAIERQKLFEAIGYTESGAVEEYPREVCPSLHSFTHYHDVLYSILLRRLM